MGQFESQRFLPEEWTKKMVNLRKVGIVEVGNFIAVFYKFLGKFWLDRKILFIKLVKV